jgi:hypothetical protein
MLGVRRDRVADILGQQYGRYPASERPLGDSNSISS